MTLKRWLVLAVIAAVVVAIPAAAADFSVRLISQTSSRITLGWDAQPNVVNYTFYANGKRVSNTYDGTRTSVTFAKVNCTVSPCYAIQALVEGGRGGYSPSAPPPSGLPAPQNLHVVTATQTSIEIAWDAVSGATNYRIYRNGTLVGEGPGSSGGFSNSWNDTGRTCGTSYNYAVEAQNSTSTSPQATLTASTTACSPPPTSPACSDGADNDGDGKIDYPADPGCTSASDTDETDTTPPPPPGDQTTVTPSQFQTLAVAGAQLSNYHVTGSVSITHTNVAISNSAFDGEIDFTPSAGGSSLRNSSALGFSINGADGIVLENNRFDGQKRVANNIIWDEPAGNSPSNWVIRGNDFRNYYVENNTSVHAEAIFVGYSDHGLIENNTFENNGNTSHIFFSWFGNLASPPASDPHDICVRSNTFGPTWTAYFDVNTRDELNPTTLNLRVDPTSNVFSSGVDDSRLLVAC